jgi:hypothetical protein
VKGKTTPQIHPVQRLTTPDGTEADIDTEIVPLVRVLWALGLGTTASCQDFGEGVAGQRKVSQHPPEKGGDAFIAYYTGFTWLKMPTQDAQRLATVLLHTEFRDNITRRWEQGSWRMHIPVTFDESQGVSPASTTQIHFPRQQVAKLTLTLEHMGRLQISHHLATEGEATSAQQAGRA